MRPIVLFAVASLPFAVHAQFSNGCFHIGDTQFDGARAVVSTSDGGAAFAGLTYSYSSMPGTNENMYVVKVGANGDVEWSTGIGGAGTGTVHVVYDLIQTADGGYALAGVNGSLSMCLAKLDAAGTVEWFKQYDTNLGALDVLSAVLQTADGGYCLVGNGGSLMSYSSPMLIKTDEDGGIEWSRAYAAGTGYGEALDGVLTLDGGYALCSYYGLDIGMQLLRLDGTGAIQWAKRYRTSGTNDYATALLATADTGFVLAGRSSTAGFAVPLENKWDALATKLNKNGVVEWSRAFGDTTFSETFHGVTATSDGGYAMAGEASQPGFTNPRMFVVKCEANGTRSWSQLLGQSIQPTRGYDIAETSDGGLVVAGDEGAAGLDVQGSFMKMEADGTICPACGPVAYGRDSSAVLSADDLTFTVYDNVATATDYTVTPYPGGLANVGCTVTGLADNANTDGGMTIAPNPGSDHFTLQLSPGHYTIEILDALGRCVRSERISDKRATMDTSDLPSGTYFVRARNDRAQLLVQRWVKE